MLCTRPPKTYISVRPTRYSHELITQTGRFVINLTTGALVRAADFCGVRSGRELDKFSAMHLGCEPAGDWDCPMLPESPVSILCQVTQTLPLGSHDMFMADIAGVLVEEQYIDPNGRLCLERCGLAAYAHGDYFSLGKKLGDFGFSVRKKRPKNPRRQPPQKRKGART